MEFFNRSGKQIGELRNFAAKLIRDAGATAVAVATTGTHVASGGERDTATLASVQQIESFLRMLIADQLSCRAEDLDTHVGYYEMGLTSAALLELVATVSTRVGVSLPPTLLF